MFAVFGRGVSGSFRRGYTSLRVWILLAWLLAVAISAAPRLCAQAQDLSALNQQAWSTEEGLPQSSVHSILQSSDGYLWFATEGGVARFDGYSFTVYGQESSPAFTSNDITSIAEAPKGVLWFGTSDGLVRLQGSTLKHIGEKDGLPSAPIVSLLATNDKDTPLLVLTAAGLVRYDGKRLVAMAGLKEPIVALAQAGKDVVLLGARQAFRYVRGEVAPFALPRTAAGERERVVKMGSDPTGATWVATARTVDVISARGTRSLSLPRDMPEAKITAVCLGRDDVVWVGTTRGLFVAAPLANGPLERVEGFGNDAALSLLQDREGNQWVGTENTGVHVLRARKFAVQRAALGEATTAVVKTSDGVLCFGTRDEGIRCVRGERASSAADIGALTSPVILSLAAGLHGDLWAGTPDGLNHVQGGKVHRYTSADGLPDDFIRSVLVASDGVVWLGTRYGLASLQNDKINVYTRADGLPSDSIGPMLERRSIAVDTLPDRNAPAPALWIGTAAGLSFWDGHRFHNDSAGPGGASRPAQIVTALAQDNSGSLWVALQHGQLAHVVAGQIKVLRATGLPDDIVDMSADAAGFLWLRGKRGVAHVSSQELNACADEGRTCPVAVDVYGAQDGMPSDELTAQGSPTLWAATPDELWVATRKGLALAHPLHLPFNDVPPPVAIERFAVDDQTQAASTAPLRIGSGHHSFTFDYAGLSYTMPSRTRYRYKLEGFDRDWVDAGTRRTAYYTSLPGRHYQFRVMACNNDGIWSPVGAMLRFSVAPPVYLRWWFFVLIALLLLSAFAALFQLRLRSVERQFALLLKERNRVAREVHDTLAQDFVSVSLQLELVSQMVRANRMPEATAQLQATRTLVKKGLEAARQSIWDLRANVAENSLPVRVRQVVEAFAQRHPETRVTVGGAYRAVEERIEGQVLRVLQESLSNVDRHAAATEVAVDLRYGPDKLALTVRDNGCGFTAAEARERDGHYGLRGMEERAAELGGSLRVGTDPGKGTTVLLEVPLRPGEERT